MPVESFDTLLGSIGTAVKQALQAVDEYAVESFMNNFELTGDEAQPLRPKMVDVPMPMPDGTFQVRQIPRLALMHHHSLRMDEIRIRFRVSLSRPRAAPSPFASEAPSPFASGGSAVSFAEVEENASEGKAAPSKPKPPPSPPPPPPLIVELGPGPGSGAKDDPLKQDAEYTEIDAVFKREPAAEGMSRLCVEYYKLI
jgi:Protein of unknown function (DUF2589)